MKEVCGYKDLYGKYHDTKVSCEKADLSFRTDEMSRRLDRFKNDIESHLFDKFIWHDSDTHRKWSYEESKIMEVVATKVLQHSDMFITIINDKKKMEKDLDKLRKQRDSWWLKTKWW